MCSGKQTHFSFAFLLFFSLLPSFFTFHLCHRLTKLKNFFISPNNPRTRCSCFIFRYKYEKGCWRYAKETRNRQNNQKKSPILEFAFAWVPHTLFFTCACAWCGGMSLYITSALRSGFSCRPSKTFP